MEKRTAPLPSSRPLLRVDPETGHLRERTYALRVVSGPDAGLTRELTAPVTLGTHPSAGVVLQDGTVSRFHVELRPRADGLQVVDLQSRNGTFLGETRVQDIVVEGEALLRIGQTVLRLTLREQEQAVGEAEGPARFGDGVTRTPAVRRLFGLLERVARSDSTVLLLGETGVGKEVLARGLHQASPRKDHPFVVVDCGALAPNLVESELFGHVKGAFTGAAGNRAGAFVEARQGTLFLDEMGELPLELQPKLLRALDSRTVKPVGADTFQEVDVRLVAATHRDLAEQVRAGTFRQDLYFRLSVVPVKVPPLRERLGDLPVLVEHFVQRARPDSVVDVSSEVLALFEGYAWPGNLRELRNVVERALAGVELEPPVAAPAAGARASPPTPGAGMDLSLPFKEAKRQLMDTFTRAYLENLSARFEGNVTQMARSAGVARHYLRELLQRHGLHGSEDSE